MKINVLLEKLSTRKIEKTFLIAGPCSVESEEQIMQTALGLADYEVNELREPHSWLRLEGLITFRHECT